MKDGPTSSLRPRKIELLPLQRAHNKSTWQQRTNSLFTSSSPLPFPSNFVGFNRPTSHRADISISVHTFFRFTFHAFRQAEKQIDRAAKDLDTHPGEYTLRRRPYCDAEEVSPEMNQQSVPEYLEDRSFLSRQKGSPSPFKDSRHHHPYTSRNANEVKLDRGLLDVSIDFTRPDGYRSRPLLAESRRLYVCEHYLGTWSPILRAYMSESPGKEINLPNVKYRHLMEVLECISPMHKEINERNYQMVLPIAFEYQMDGLSKRVEHFLLNSRLPFIERIWLADKYLLERLLGRCLREIRPNDKMDFSGPRYHSLSDRVKVLLLERIHGHPAPEDIPDSLHNLERFARKTENHFASITGSNGRTFYINPYYVAAWSTSLQERLASNNANEFSCGASVDELKAFLLAIHPPQIRITEENVGPVLISACKLESQGLMRRCARFILGPAEMSVFAKLSLIDRCFLHELLEPCLRTLVTPEQAMDMTLQPTYDCLSTKARAAILDRLSSLLSDPGLSPHHCIKCRQNSRCPTVTWECPHCGQYSPAEEKLYGDALRDKPSIESRNY